MQIATTTVEIRKIISTRRTQAAEQGKSLKIGFVPTMGALHQGHLSLVEMAQQECNLTVAYVFVNPLQFAPHEDFNHYPRNLEKDSQLLAQTGTDVLFAPTVTEIYPEPMTTFVEEIEIARSLEGEKRPGHFRGVTTVVTKMLNIVQPDICYFGQKDLQQYLVLERLFRDLAFPAAIRMAPTVREPDGLAMSSRNAYLTKDERQVAPILFQTMSLMRDLYNQGTREVKVLRDFGINKIKTATEFRVDYLEIVQLPNLMPIDILSQPADRPTAAILVAASLGRTRLIDNILI